MYSLPHWQREWKMPAADRDGIWSCVIRMTSMRGIWPVYKCWQTKVWTVLFFVWPETVTGKRCRRAWTWWTSWRCLLSWWTGIWKVRTAVLWLSIIYREDMQQRSICWNGAIVRSGAWQVLLSWRIHRDVWQVIRKYGRFSVHVTNWLPYPHSWQ